MPVRVWLSQFGSTVSIWNCSFIGITFPLSTKTMHIYLLIIGRQWMNSKRYRAQISEHHLKICWYFFRHSCVCVCLCFHFIVVRNCHAAMLSLILFCLSYNICLFLGNLEILMQDWVGLAFKLDRFDDVVDAEKKRRNKRPISVCQSSYLLPFMPFQHFSISSLFRILSSASMLNIDMFICEVFSFLFSHFVQYKMTTSTTITAVTHHICVCICVNSMSVSLFFLCFSFAFNFITCAQFEIHV